MSPPRRDRRVPAGGEDPVGGLVGPGARLEPAARKAELRREMQSRRAALQLGDVRRLSADLAGRLLAWPPLLRAHTVLAYSALRREPQTAAIVRALHEHGAVVALPLVVGTELVPRRAPAVWAGGDAAAVATALAGQPEVPLASVEAVLVPGLAFDRFGRRLGRGGGHYDRLLQRLAADCLRVGLCFECQFVAEVPAEPWDQPVHAIATEVTIRPAARGGHPDARRGREPERRGPVGGQPLDGVWSDLRRCDIRTS